MKRYLQICVEIEETAASIYRQLAKSKNLPAELQDILQELANDEDDHASQLRFALRFSPTSVFNGKAIDRTPAQALLKRAKELHDQTCQQDFDTAKAIETGIELEHDFCQAHIGNCMEFKEDSLKKMFSALAQDDKVHIQKLLNAKAMFF